MSRLILVTFVSLLSLVDVQATDWSMYRADAARSGYTPDRLGDVISLRWMYRSPNVPMPAWPSRSREQFDRAYQPVIAGGSLYFGSSADCKVHALEAVTGKTLWTFFTNSPVRFAPVVWQDRVFVAGDDGHLYCLAAADGKLLWKLRGGPREDMLLGNDRMISRWPGRGGPVVAGGVVYFGAGIWPTEGIFIYAIDPATGKVLWCNDSSGSIEMDQPHGDARAKSGVAAQGYLAVQADALFVPTGRAVPAVFDRSGGKLRYFHLSRNQHVGGCEVMLIDDHFFNGGVMFATADGATRHPFGTQVAAHPDLVISSTNNKIIAFDRRGLLVDKQVTDRKGKKKIVKALGPPVWTAPLSHDADAGLIVVGEKVVAGGQNKVSLVDIRSHRVVWTNEVDGTACGLAAADGRLYVSTDRGAIYCFGAAGTSEPATVGPTPQPPESDRSTVYATAAEEIIRRSGVTDGYCLDLACGDGHLALELARRTDLQIYAVEADPAKVHAARQMLDAAGLYGVRVMVHQTDPQKVPYPNSFADLIVSGRSIIEGPSGAVQKAAGRLQRPCGGIVCIGKPGAMELSLRGPLEGTGNWTHQYADPANTLCSSDTRLKGPLEMLWFRDTDFLMPNRHGRGPAPLVDKGRMFVEGLNGLRAVNIYNGCTLWEFPLEGILAPYHQEGLLGTAWTGSNFCLGSDRVYVHTGNRCLCLDVGSGRKVAELQPPPRSDGKPGTWGYIACQDDTLFGSLVNEQHLVKPPWPKVKPPWPKCDMSRLFTESLLLFALDRQTGELKWAYTPEHFIRNNAIVVGNGRVYLIDRPLAAIDRLHFNEATARAEAKKRTKANATDEAEEFRKLTEHGPGRLLALDGETGKVLWKIDEDVFGTLLAFSAKHNVLLMSYQPAHATLDSELGARMAGIRASDGVRLWDVKAQFRHSRPVLNSRTVYFQPGAWDLLTGKQLPFTLTRSYGCGILTGSAQLLVFRSATLGYIDLVGTRRTENYGGIRPGCWVNAIPAGGLVLMADAASWCTCSYLNQATIALQPGSSTKGVSP